MVKATPKANHKTLLHFQAAYTPSIGSLKRQNGALNNIALVSKQLCQRAANAPPCSLFQAAPNHPRQPENKKPLAQNNEWFSICNNRQAYSTFTSTRRPWALLPAAAVVFSGLRSSMFLPSTPCFSKNACTAWARFLESSALAAALPVLSV